MVFVVGIIDAQQNQAGTLLTADTLIYQYVLQAGRKERSVPGKHQEGRSPA